MIQTGDPTGTGAGGESAFGGMPFKDEFDSRLVHDTRGVVSMANAGPNSNRSQFFITFASASHLNNKHTIFGRVVGGMITLDRMEAVSVHDDNSRPITDITIINTRVFTNPIPEADALLMEDIRRHIDERIANEWSSALPKIKTKSAGDSVVPSSLPSISEESAQKTSSSRVVLSSSSSSSGSHDNSHTNSHKINNSNSSSSMAPVSRTPTAADAVLSLSATNDKAVEEFLQSQNQQNELTRAEIGHELKKKPKPSYNDFSNW
jgi:hypothetical protein